jgi:hypothetical protein
VADDVARAVADALRVVAGFKVGEATVVDCPLDEAAGADEVTASGEPTDGATPAGDVGPALAGVEPIPDASTVKLCGPEHAVSATARAASAVRPLLRDRCTVAIVTRGLQRAR